MNRGKVYTRLGFIARPLHQCTAHTMHLRRIYAPLGFNACPLEECILLCLAPATW